MNHYRFLLHGATITIAALLLSCGPSVNFTSTGGKREPKPSASQVYVFTASDSLPPGAVLLGSISVKDAGLTIHCDYDVVLAAAQDRARQVGADAIKIISVSKPDLLSSCYGIDAFAVALDKADTSHLAEKLKSPSYADFLTFSSAPACHDYGDTSFLAAANLKVHLIPFMVRINREGTIVKQNYPATEPAINQYLRSMLESRFKSGVLAAPVISVDSIKTFSDAVLDTAAIGKRSPLEWGQPLQFDRADSASVIYFPFGIERESQHHAQGRFYMLVFNASGKVVCFRCMGYNPNTWSSEADAFRRDTKGKLLLLENQ
jgi:hypothetical protein